MGNNIINIFNLSKVFKLKEKGKKIVALDNVNFSVRENEKFGLLGPNGAGKTTLVSILTTLMQPTAGHAVVDGINILKKPEKIRSKIGLMLGSDMVYYRITGYANLKFFCKIYEISNYKEKIYKISKELELDNWLNEYVEKYSTGMKVKLSLCRILLINPKILFLDEPTLGLDIKTTNLIINKLKNLEKTIFLTSHNMNVIEKLCDRVAFIKEGKIINIGNKEALIDTIQKGIKIAIEINQNKEKLILELEQQEFIEEIDNIEGEIIIYLKKRIYYKDLFSILRKYPILKFQEINISIEELFLRII